MLKLKEKLMEFCEGNVSTYSKSNNLPNMFKQGSEKLNNKKTNKRTKQTYKQKYKTIKQTNLIEIELTLNQETT